MSFSRPNILIFQTDQQRWDTTCLDSPCKTPNFDRLKRNGITFNKVFPTMAHCCPSRASMMTGLYPSQTGIWNNVCNNSELGISLKPGCMTFSERLRDAGYSLFYTGKWHVSATENPENRGWQELLVTEGKERKMGWPMRDWAEKKVKDTIDPKDRQRGEVLKPGWGTLRLYGERMPQKKDGNPEKEYMLSHDYPVVQSAIHQVQQFQTQPQHTPWCLYVGLTHPHDPFIVPPKYASMYNPDTIKLPGNYRDDMKGKPEYYKRMKKQWDQLTESEVRECIAHYYGFCTMVDDMLGELMHEVEKLPDFENTVVIFTSDHGEFLGSHGLYCKGIAPYDEGYRVPLVFHWPQGIKNPGREIDELVSLMDLAPTCIDLGNAVPLEKCMGMSLIPFLKDEPVTQWRDALYMQCNGVELNFTQRIVRTKDYKFVYNPVAVDELYDLKADPLELVNVSDDPAYPTVKKELYIRMWRLAVETDDDDIASKYHTVTTATYGPLFAFRPKDG